jgi:uncharacterized membrane protein SpoIIM required for sporulation
MYPYDNARLLRSKPRQSLSLLVAKLIGYAVAIVTFLAGVVFLTLAAVLIRGYCLSVLWGWFVVPIFGLPALTIAGALGLALVLNYFLRASKEGGGLTNVFSEAVVVLVIGYIFHLFI